MDNSEACVGSGMRTIINGGFRPFADRPRYPVAGRSTQSGQTVTVLNTLGEPPLIHQG